MEHVLSVRPTGKFPEKVENLKRWARFPGWNFRTEFRVSFTRFSSFVPVPGPRLGTATLRGLRPNGTTREQLFTNRKFHVAPTEISVFFFPNGKRPSISERGLIYRTAANNRAWGLPKRGISYIPWCIASYYIIKLPNARDAISSTRTWQLNSSGKRLVLPIKLSVPLLCRSIYDFRFTIPNISVVKSKRVFCTPIMS